MKSPAAKARITVLCVDDHRLVREGIALIVERQADMDVVGMAATADESIRLFDRLRPGLGSRLLDCFVHKA